MLKKQQRMSMYGSGQRRRVSPLLLIGVSVPVALALIVTAVVVFIVPRLASHAAAAVNVDCTLIVPANPLSAQGLSTPYQLVATNPANGPCNEGNKMQGAFVQGAIIDRNTGQISIYNPLVIDQGTQPAVKPVVPTLPARNVVALWFGFNGNNLTLQSTNGSLQQGRCVNGVNNSIFGQFAYCNAPRFFAAANNAIQAGQLVPPALGMANDGKVCPTVRDFRVVDMDQSDNVTTQYYITANGQAAQLTAANTAALVNAGAQMQTPAMAGGAQAAGAQAQAAAAKPIANASDNRLLDVALDGALGCTPWMAPDLADPGNMVPALPLNELQAAAHQAAPIALVPANDPMVLNNNQTDLNKINAYRAGVDQMPAATLANASTTTYCTNLLNIAPASIQLDMQFTNARPSPDPAVATTLFTFLGQRSAATFSANGLNCVGLLNKPNPTVVTTDGNGVATAVTITVPNAGAGNGGAGNGGAGNGGAGNGGAGNGGTGNGGTGNGGTGNGGTGTPMNTPVSCTVNGTAVPNCTGTVTINGQTCTLATVAATNQVNITCPTAGGQQPQGQQGQQQTPQATPSPQVTPSPQATQQIQP